MSEEVTQVRLLDRTYNIKCESHEIETLFTAAAYLEDRIKNMQAQKRLAFTDAVLLCALDICGQHIQQYQSVPLHPPPENALSDKELNQVNWFNDQIKKTLATEE